MSVITNTMLTSIDAQIEAFEQARQHKDCIILTERTFAGGRLYQPGDVIDADLLPRKIELPVRYGVEVARPTRIARLVATATDATKRRLLEGDPDWQEFKQQWAAEHGPIGDEDGRADLD